MDARARFNRLLSSFIFICVSLIIFKPFITNQIMARGDGYVLNSMYRNAIRQYKKALLLNPRNSKIMNWLGFSYGKIDNKDKAIDIYEKSIVVNPQNIIGYYDLGMIYLMDKKYKLAKEYFLKASVVPYDDKKIAEEDFHFYNRLTSKMLSYCQKKLKEINNHEK